MEVYVKMKNNRKCVATLEQKWQKMDLPKKSDANKNFVSAISEKQQKNPFSNDIRGQ